MGLELAGVKGTGPGGRIVKADVEAAAKQDEPSRRRSRRRRKRRPKKEKAPAADSGRGEITQEELSRLQRTVARRMAESKATAPDFVMTLEVDMEEAVQLRGQLKAAAGDDPAPSFNDFVIKASALALKDFPRANGAYRDGQFELYSRINIGIAVAGQDALVVPTIFDADKKGLGTIAGEARGLAEQVREGRSRRPSSQRDVHDLQPRHVRDPPLHRRDQPAAGGDPRRRRADAAPRRARRRGGRSARSWSSRSPATTGSSTAPTRPSSWGESASTSRRRYGLRFSPRAPVTSVTGLSVRSPSPRSARPRRPPARRPWRPAPEARP